jgi:outer membrane protein
MKDEPFAGAIRPLPESIGYGLVRARGFLIGLVFFCAFSQAANAQTLKDALSHAYVANPQLNAARAALRATNENVPQALSGQRPSITANADAFYETDRFRAPGGAITNRTSVPRGASVEFNQTLFDGFRTPYLISQAEAQVLAERELLRTTEQDVLLAGVSVYMDVVRDTAILDLRNNFVDLLGEQKKESQKRFDVGELTKTDVAQSEARLALARSQMEAAKAQLNASRANFRRVIGSDVGKLRKEGSVDALLPKSVKQAEAIGLIEHPQIRAAVYGIDAADFAIGIAESGLWPTVSVGGSLERRYEVQSNIDRLDSAAIGGRVTMPLYDGGFAPSQVRQTKERLGQRRLDADSVRDQIRALIVANWGNFEAAKAQVLAQNAQTSASDLALFGVREEARVGQRTVLDTLNAEQELLDARVNGVVAERNRIVAAYALLGAVGRLNAQILHLNVAAYDPAEHYNAVRDRWHGLRTPDEEKQGIR